MPFPFGWWRKVRKAVIPKSDRDMFKRFGETVIGSVLTSGLTPRTRELQHIYNNPANAAEWLTERGDSHEQREQRLETAEWFILVFVFLGVIVEGVQLLREFGFLQAK
jgi:hypothetical protein